MSRRTRKNIGLVGLGLIGSRVREVLRRKGFQVFVWNRTPRPVPNFVGAPAELAEMCDFIQVFVSDDDALLFVVKQLSPALSARHIVISHPTVAPHTMVAAAEIVERRGARFIEAPFTGSKEAAETGELVYYIGADNAVLAEARPLLQASSKEILEIGEIGQATAIKVATNMVTAATVQASAEALALVQATGLPAELFMAAMKQNASFSKTLAMKLPKMVERNFERHFSVQHMLKDMQIASRLGLASHLELGVTAAARDRLLEQAQRGHGDDDYSAVARKYSQEARIATEAELELFQKRTSEPPPRSETPKPTETKIPVTGPADQQTPASEPVVTAAKPAATTAPGEPESTVSPEPARGVAIAEAERAPAPAAHNGSEHTPEANRVAEPTAPAVAEPHPTSSPGATLEALQAHVPAAPFLNPVGGNESVTAELHPATTEVAKESRDFVSQPAGETAEEESSEPRGFFSRLLRRANS
jgi:3-hydroxyisobutyrate dehydrogenase-like beta-hydroxyacid dehydrogenase